MEFTLTPLKQTQLNFIVKDIFALVFTPQAASFGKGNNKAHFHYLNHVLQTNSYILKLTLGHWYVILPNETTEFLA